MTEAPIATPYYTCKLSDNFKNLSRFVIAIKPWIWSLAGIINRGIILCVFVPLWPYPIIIVITILTFFNKNICVLQRINQTNRPCLRNTSWSQFCPSLVFNVYKGFGSCVCSTFSIYMLSYS